MLMKWMGIDLRARWKRRVAVVATSVAYFIFIGWASELKLPHHAESWLILAGYLWLGFFSVLAGIDWARAKWITSGDVIVNNIDDWSLYMFGKNFASLSEADKNFLLPRYRTGTHYLSARFSRDPAIRSSAAGWSDEREKYEYQKAVFRTVRWLSRFAMVSAGGYAVARNPIDGMEIAASIIFFVSAMQLGPRAILLWETPDPRDDGELHLVSPLP
jgi:hypothetical protein